ncbi:MAG: hypothetical protein ABSH12_04885 [Endomicrobiales bacterium]
MKKLILFFVAGMMLFSANLFADMSCCKDCCCTKTKDAQHDKMLKKMTKQLNLSADQAKQIAALWTAFKDDCDKRSSTLKGDEQAKMEALQKNPPDFSTAKTKIQEIDSLMTQNKMAMMDTKEKEFGILTPDQKDKYSKMMCDGKGKKNCSCCTCCKKADKQ